MLAQPNDTDFLSGLNSPQQTAVEHGCGPLMVVAGAGSGKTRVLTRRIAYLVSKRQTAPEKILAVTFTNKAAGEMRSRLKGLLGEPSERLWVSTFHSLGLRLLRRYATLLGYRKDFVIYDASDVEQLIKRILKELQVDVQRYSPRMFLAAIDGLKNDPDNYKLPFVKQSQLYELFSRVNKRYAESLKEAVAMDFSDLLLNTKLLLSHHQHVREFLQSSLEYILVDEFQDTNPIQYEIVTQLAGSKRNIMVVGDDDQAIYAFRGATVRNMFRFKKDFPEAPVVALEQNYRSTAIILESAHSVVEKNVNRTKKKLWTDGPKGHPIKLYVARDESDEAAYIAAEIKRISHSRSLRDIAIFYRTNAQSRALEEALIAMGIAYQIYGGLRFYDRKEVRDILGYLRLIVNHSDTEAFLRVIGNPPRGIGAKTIESIDNLRGSGTFLDGARLLAKQNVKVAAFIEQIDSLIASSRQYEPAALIGLIVEQTGYGERLKQEGEETRLENLEELAALARTVELEDAGRTPQELLSRFLDRISLSGSDEIQNVSANGSVSLMTLHLAKGLEFPVVFFSGLEDGLLPHVRTFDKDDELAEERRLCYVGITRAMECLYLTRACWRASRSGPDCRMESRFLQDIPAHCIELDPTSYGDLNDEKYSSTGSDLGEKMPNYFTGNYSRGKSFRNDTFSPRSRRLGGSYSVDNIPVIRSADDLRMKDSKSGLKANLASMPILPVADASALREGVRVRHPIFGDGTVLNTEGLNTEILNTEGAQQEGMSLKITVVFDRSGETKRLAYQHARLAVIQ